MFRLCIILIFVTISSHAYTDSDIDGVEDKDDFCPQTPFSDLVDQEGCTIKSMGNPLHYNLSTGIGFSQVNYASQEPSDTLTASLQASIYAGKWCFQGVMSHYQSDNGVESESGLEDTALSLMYQFTPTERLTLTTGIGIIVPTYETLYHNEATDYTVSIDVYYLINQRISLFAGTNYTLVNDHDVPQEKYQNTSGFHTGIEYTYTNGKASFTTAYYQNKSIYVSAETIKYLNFGYTYSINPHWSIRGIYGYGLSESASNQSMGAYVGYVF